MTCMANLGFREKDFNERLFLHILQNVSKSARYIEHEKTEFSGSGLITTLTSEVAEKESERVVGFRSFLLQYCDDLDGTKHSINLVFKIIRSGNEMGRILYDAFVEKTGGINDQNVRRMLHIRMDNSERKEIACYRAQDSAWKAILPETFMTQIDSSKGVYLIAMEDLCTDAFTHYNDTDPENWSEQERRIVLEEMARFHALHYGKTEMIPKELKDLIDKSMEMYDKATEKAVRKVYMDMFERSYLKNEPMKQYMLALLHKTDAKIDHIRSIIQRSPMTLVHTDFNLPNICFRKEPNSNQSKLCVYDWGDVQLMPPQYDAACFILNFISDDNPAKSAFDLLEIYRVTLLRSLEEDGSPVELIQSVEDIEQFHAVFDMCLINMFWQKIGASICNSTTSALFQHLARNGMNYISAVLGKYEFLE